MRNTIGTNAFGRSLLLLVSVLLLGLISACSGGSKTEMVVYKDIGIPDGEFLRYGEYTGGEKVYEVVYVTRTMTDAEGNLLYIVYSDYLPLDGSKKLNPNYQEWPTKYTIDPRKGAVLEAVQFYSTKKEDMEALKQYGMKDIFYTHYALLPQQGRVEYVTKSIKDSSLDIDLADNTEQRKFRVNVKSDKAVWEATVSVYFAPRIMDMESGILYLVVPQFMKEPLPNVYKVIAKEDLVTAAGSFKVVRLDAQSADRFIGKLLGPIMKGSGYWVEDSPRRLVVKIMRNGNGDGSILEHVSTIAELEAGNP